MLSVAIIPDSEQILPQNDRSAIRERILRRIRRMWPGEDHRKIVGLLERYGSEKHEKDPERVQLALLKLSEGNFDSLPELVKMAKSDWQDVIAMAESPEEMRTGPVAMKRMARSESDSLRSRDRKQYSDWISGS